MKTKVQIMMAVTVAVSFAAGCASAPKTKPIQERGWIGGDFQRASRDQRPEGERATVYVRQVFTHTPSAQAGLQPADLILALDGHPVARLSDFRTRVDAAKPGQIVTVTVLRDSHRLEIPVTIGRERYESWHSFQLGLGFTSHLDILPDPNFSLLPVASFHRETDRVELNSPESILKRTARENTREASEELNSQEGWNAWLAVFGLGAHKKIVSQEIVPPLRAQRQGNQCAAPQAQATGVWAGACCSEGL
jgi:hypothetical protein